MKVVQKPKMYFLQSPQEEETLVSVFDQGRTIEGPNKGSQRYGPSEASTSVSLIWTGLDSGLDHVTNIRFISFFSFSSPLCLFESRFIVLWKLHEIVIC